MQSIEAWAEYLWLLKRFSLDVTSSKKPSWTSGTRMARPFPAPLGFWAVAFVALALRLCCTFLNPCLSSHQVLPLASRDGI